MSDWATALAVAIKGIPSEFEIMIGSVVSPKPLSIRVSGVVISRQIYINPAYIIATDAEITDIFRTEMPKSPKINEFLQAWHTTYTLKAGDTIIVLKNGTTLYVLEKVVSI